MRAPGGDAFDRAGRVSVLAPGAPAFTAPADPAQDGQPVELFAGAQRLSVPGQIVVDARAAALADGTALAAWVDESRTTSRMELAVRPPAGPPIPARAAADRRTGADAGQAS